MKLSEVLKNYCYAFSEIEDIKVIACDDVCKMALTCTTCNGISVYDIYTLNDLNHRKLINCYFDKETAERAYNLLIEHVKKSNHRTKSGSISPR